VVDKQTGSCGTTCTTRPKLPEAGSDDLGKPGVSHMVYYHDEWCQTYDSNGCNCDSEPVIRFFAGATHPSPLARRRRSGSHAKNDVHDPFDFTETLRVEVEGDFDVFVVFPGDLEGEACGCELNEPQAVVAGVGIVIEGLDVADAAIIILELTLNKKIGLIGGRQVQVIFAGVLIIERDLEIFAAGLSDRHMFSVESH
jgi:hypothetical protein